MATTVLITPDKIAALEWSILAYESAIYACIGTIVNLYITALNIINIEIVPDGGVFSPMKMLLKIHRGFRKSLKLKMIDEYLTNYKKK